MKLRKNLGILILIIGLMLTIILPLKQTSAIDSNNLKDNSTTKTIDTKNNGNQITDNIFSEITMLRSDGSEILENDTIPNGAPLKLNLNFSFNEKNYNKGDYFITKIPSQIDISNNLEGDFKPLTSAKWSVDSQTNELKIEFLENNIKKESYDLSIITSLKEVEASSEEKAKLVFTTNPNDTIYNLEFQSNVTNGSKAKIVADKNFNQKTAKIEGVYNLNRIDDDKRTFALNTSISGVNKPSIKNIKVYSSDVNFKGKLEGTPKELEQDVDYEISNVTTSVGNVGIEVKMKTSLNKKALIIKADLNDINSSVYSTPSQLKRDNIYVYASSLLGDKQIDTDSNYLSLYSGQPLGISAVLNKETNNIDWTIVYNHNERDLDTNSKIESIIEDNGVEYIVDSINIKEVELTKVDNKYTVDEKEEISNEYNINMEANGSFSLNPKNKTNKGIIIRYSTKITDPEKRDIKNTVKNDTDSKQATISTTPDLFEKEDAEVDLYNQTMSWKITVNKDKYKLTNAYVHDYFIEHVIDYTKIEVIKKDNDGSDVALELDKDYKLASFDKDGNPLGVQPNVNGAPDSFNGGVRLDFIGDYKDLKDTVEIKIVTKLNTKDFNEKIVKIKNIATLNYGDIPGVITYDADGNYENPYYQGGAKIVSNTKDAQYNYQNWLIAINVSGNKYNKITMEDDVVDSLEIIPDSLVFDEIVSSEMLDNISRYTTINNNLAKVGDDVYPTKIAINNNKINLEFDNIKNKKVFVKFKTRIPRQWYANSYFNNTAKVSFDGVEKEFDARTNVYNLETALQKVVEKDPEKSNVAKWTVKTTNINQYLKVENPIISDEIKNNYTNARYDTTSFSIFDATTNERIDSKYYDLDISKNSYKITFKNFTATNNFKVEYRTISEYPGKVSNEAVIESDSYNDLFLSYRSKATSISLSFTSGSGSGLEKLGGFEIEKVDSRDSSKKLEGAEFEILKSDGQQTGLKRKTDDNGNARFDDISYGEYILKEIQAPDKYLISGEYAKGKKIVIDSDYNQKRIVIENYLAPTLANVELHKTDFKTNKPLQGAEFKLLDKNNKVIAKNLKTNKAGVLKYNNLLSNTYKFVEIKAPKGYVLDRTPIEFTLIPGQTTIEKVKFTNVKLPEEHVNKKKQKKIVKTGYSNLAIALLLTSISLTGYVYLRKINQ